FFKTNDIEINKQKTICILGKGKKNRPNSDVISPEDSTIRFGESHITVSPTNTSHRYLGIWISGNNSPTLVYFKLQQEILNINGVFYNKPITEKMTAYITNAVMLLIIEYRTKDTFLTSCQSAQ